MKIIKDLGSKLNQQGDINNALDIERESEESTLMKYPLLENQLSKASCALDYLKWSEVTQSCPTLCNPMDCSLPGSIHGIFQARILEWVAISFSNVWKWKVKVKSLSHVPLFVTPWTAAYQAPSMGFSRQEYWSGVPLPSPIRSMNQGKLEVVKQEMARVIINILGISELKWTGMGEFNSDDHYIY